MQVWKVPTGLVSQGEDFDEAAEREVLEETGVRGKFSAVLALRQAHGLAFGKSDLFFMCAIVPEPGQDELVPQVMPAATVIVTPTHNYAIYYRPGEAC